MRAILPTARDRSSFNLAGTKAGQEAFYKTGWYVVEGAIDNEKAGKYTITVRAQDKHGNEAKQKFTVKVTDSQSEQAAEESSEITYVLNVNSQKFHYPYCPSAEDTKPENRRDSTESREEIIAKGFKPCKRCNP